MPRLRPSDLLLPAACALAALAVVLLARWTVAEWVFGTVVLTGLALLGRHLRRSVRATRRQRAEADRLTRTPTATVAEAAVAAERVRLSAEIEACVRELLVSVAARAARAEAAADPRPELRLIQADAQQANAELRRQLGLLRTESAPIPSPTPPAPPTARVRRTDLLLTAAVLLLAGLDVLIGVRLAGAPVSALSVVLTLATAATLVLRRSAPRTAACAAAAVLLLGALVGQPVLDGFALIVVVGVLGFTLAAAARPADWAVLLVFGLALATSRWFADVDNVAVSIALLGTAAVAGGLVGRSRRRREAAAVVAEVRGGELRDAADEAVRAERRSVAGELHDLLAHAVSVIAVQAGAAELSWPADPALVRRSVDVVRNTASDTLTELDRLVPGKASPSSAVPDLDALVARIRAAGLPVDCDLQPVEPALAPTVYRIVQESLTNALRHAPGGTARVELGVGADGVVVRVTNSLPERQPRAGRGYGLTGLAERVQRCGGTLEAGIRDEPPRFEVTAVLPVPAAVVST